MDLPGGCHVRRNFNDELRELFTAGAASRQILHSQFYNSPTYFLLPLPISLLLLTPPTFSKQNTLNVPPVASFSHPKTILHDTKTPLPCLAASCAVRVFALFSLASCPSRVWLPRLVLARPLAVRGCWRSPLRVPLSSLVGETCSVRQVLRPGRRRQNNPYAASKASSVQTARASDKPGALCLRRGFR